VTDKKTFIRNYDYDACLVTGKIWTVHEALEYLAAYLTNKESWAFREKAFSEFIRIKDQLLRALMRSIEEGSLIINEELHDDCNVEAGISPSEVDFSRATIVPIVFICWAIDNKIEVPKQFEQYAKRKKNNNSAYHEGLGVKKSCVHHERCRAVAELLWSHEPELTIADMARRSEIIQFGCEGHKYNMRTISRWLASLKVDRKPGRSKKVDRH